MPKVSVIVPVYNIYPYLERCLSSVLNQTFKDWDMIVINDGSTDNSADIIYRFADLDSRIRFQTKENGGLVSARLAGLSMASSPYIFHLDGDDFLEPEALELLYSEAIEKQDDMVFFDFWIYDDISGTKTLYPNRYWETHSPEEHLEKMLLCENSWAVWSHIHKRSLYDKVDLTMLEGLSNGEDAVFTSMLVYASERIHKLNKPFLNYVRRPGSLTQVNGFSSQTYQSYWLFPQRLNDYFSKTDIFPFLKKALAFVYIKAFEETLKGRTYSRGHEFAQRAMLSLKAYPELKSLLPRRVYKLTRLFAVSQWLGSLYMKKCIRKNKI